MWKCSYFHYRVQVIISINRGRKVKLYKDRGPFQIFSPSCKIHLLARY